MSEEKKKRGRPKGSKAPGSRPDLKRRATGRTIIPAEINVELEPGGNVLSGLRQAKKQACLQAVAIHGTKFHAAKEVGISRSTIDDWIRDDPDFKKGFDAAMNDSLDHIERAFKQRTVAGVKKTIYYKGAPIGQEVHYDTVAGIVLLKAYRPQLYRERYEFSGPNGGPIETTSAIDRLVEKLGEIQSRTIGSIPAISAPPLGAEIHRDDSGGGTGESAP